MFARSFTLCLLVALCGVPTGGCGKSSSPDDPAKAKLGAESSGASRSKTEDPDCLVRVHWLGKHRLGNETNAAYFMSIWNLPETRRLEAQILDKFSLWLAHSEPARNRQTEPTNYQALVSANPAASHLRPLVEDVTTSESYLEIYAGTNRPLEAAFAIRLDDTHAARWQIAQETLRGALGACSVSRAGVWTFLTFAASQPIHPQIAALKAQLSGGGTPSAFPATNDWLNGRINCLKLSGMWPVLERLRLQLPTNAQLPILTLRVTGDGQNVRTRAEMEFARPLPLEMDAWSIPTNLIHDPLIGFTAMRSLRPFLKAFKPWNNLQLGTPPNQAYFWALRGLPQFHFLAMPSAEARNQVAKLSDVAINVLDPIFAANPLKAGGFVKSPLSGRLTWQGMPLYSPTLDSVGSGKSAVIFAGFSTNTLSGPPAPKELVGQVYGPANLVYYDWEITGQCLQGLTPLTQLTRRAFNRARLPADPAIAELLELGRRLGNSVTVMETEGSARMSLVRKSSVGFTAAEIELLIDWLQSPAFPTGTHTSYAPPEG